MASGWLRLGLAIGGAILGSFFGGIYFGVAGQSFLTGAGFMAGSVLGNMIFPQESITGMPKMGNYPVQSAQKGNAVPVIYGTVRAAGNIIWMGPIDKRIIEHSSGGGGKGGGGGEVKTYETQYYRSFLIAVCEGPAGVRRAWKGKKEIDLTDFTWYDGDENLGISTLLDEDYANYENMALAYFDTYLLGNTEAIPNFVFEVASTPYFLRTFFFEGANMRIMFGYKGVRIDVGSSVIDYGAEGGSGHRVGIKIRHHPFKVGQKISINGSANWDYGNGWSLIEGTTADEVQFYRGAVPAETFDGSEIVHRHVSLTIPMHADEDKYGNIYVATADIGGSPLITKIDVDGNVILDFFSPVGGWSGDTGFVVRVLADSTKIFVMEKHSVIYCMSLVDGSEIWKVSTGGVYAQHMVIDSNDRIYWPTHGDLCAGPLNRYSLIRLNPSDGSESLRYTNMCGTQWVDISEKYDLVVTCGEYNVLYGASFRYNLAACTLDNNNHRYKTITADGDRIDQIRIHKNGYIYCFGHTTDGKNIWKLDRDLNILDSIYVEFAGRFFFDTFGRVVILLNGYYSGGNDESYLIYDEDLNFIKTISGGTKVLEEHLDIWVPRPNIGAFWKGYEDFDENPAWIIKELVTNPAHGAGISLDDINSTSFDSVSVHCSAEDIKISILINKQKPLWDWVDFICSHFGGYRFWSEGKLNLGVFKDENSIVSLTQDNLVVQEGEEPPPPIQIRKRRYTETYNRIEVTWTDRENDYDKAVAIANDEVDQRISGQIRKKTIDLSGITNADLAQRAAYRMLIDSMYRHTIYSFVLAWQDMLLEIGDVVDLTDGHLLTSQKCRITSIGEEERGRGLNIEAVEERSDLYPTIAYNTQQTQHVPDPVVTLADVTNIAFRESITDKILHLSIVPGNASTNGWYIYRSYDDSSYELIGRCTISGVTGGDANSYGTLQSSLRSAKSVVHRGAESFLVSIGTVTDLDTAITDATFFNKLKLAKIGTEIIGYKTCVETSTVGIWRITGVLRGLFGTAPVAHISGEVFSTLDVNFSYTFRPEDVGRVIYFKAVTFYGNDIQAIVDVTAYSHTIVGNYAKPLPVSLMRIRGREGMTTYKTDDVTIDWYFSSKISGFGKGGYGNALWGAFIFDTAIQTMNAILKQTNDTEILNTIFDISAVGEPMALLIEDADRGGHSEYKVELLPGGVYTGLRSQEIQIEQI